MASHLAWDNYVASDLTGSLSVAVTGSITAAFDAAYPATNGIDPNPSLVSRVNCTTSGAGATTCTIAAQWSTTANSKTVRVAAFLNVRIPAGLTGLAVTSILTAFGGGTLATSQQSYSATDLVPIPGETDRYNLFFTFASDTACAGAAIVFSTTATFTGYYDVGTACAMKAVSFTKSVGADFAYEPIDDTEVTRGGGGGVSADTLPTRHAVHIKFPAEAYAQALGTAGSSSTPSIRAFLMEAGTGNPVVVIPSTADDHAMQVLGTYGHIRGPLPALRHLFLRYFAAELVVEQRR